MQKKTSIYVLLLLTIFIVIASGSEVEGNYGSIGKESHQAIDIKAFAQEIFELTNAARITEGLSPLSINVKLVAVATKRAEEISVSFAHERPSGASWETVLEEYEAAPYRTASENIVRSSAPATAKRFIEGLMNSPSHRENILHPAFTRLGVGVYRDEKGIVHAVQIFVGEL